MTHPQIANRKLVVIALYEAGGATEKVHTEDIAIVAHRLFPDSFSWTKHPDLIDKDIVRVALVEAARPVNGEMVTGRTGRGRGHAKHRGRAPATDGWSLNESGLRWIKEHAQGIMSAVGVSGPKEHRQQNQRVLGRIRAHPLYQSYSERGIDSELPLGEMSDLLRCRVDAEQHVIRSRIEKIRKIAIDASDEKVVTFMETLLCRISGL